MDSPFPGPLRRPAPTAGGEVDGLTSSLFISAAGHVGSAHESHSYIKRCLTNVRHAELLEKLQADAGGGSRGLWSMAACGGAS